jgi:hypothetical protein
MQNTKAMKRIILVYGLIAGTIIGGMLLITMPLYTSGTLNFDNGELLGYSTMTIAFSLIFFGVKSYRDKEMRGEITFGRAIKVGLLIALVACVVYALCWEIAYSQYGETFTREMVNHTLEKMKSEGATEAELAKTRADWEGFSELYKNPLIRFSITMLEPSPVAVLITLISAALLRRKDFLPSTPEESTNLSNL